MRREEKRKKEEKLHSVKMKKRRREKSENGKLKKGKLFCANKLAARVINRKKAYNLDIGQRDKQVD